MTAAEVKTDDLEALIEATDDIQDERAVGDILAEITDCIDHAFEAATVIRDREFALNKSAELRVEEEGASLPISKELGLNVEPGGARQVRR